MKRIFGVLQKVALAVLATTFVVLVAAAFTVLRDSNLRSLEKADAIVVLGAAQYDGIPSPVFRNRLDTAGKVWSEGYAPVIVTLGSNLPGDETTEAAAGRDYLILQFNPAPSNVIAIAEGNDTLTSLKAMHNYAKENGWNRLIFVSDSLHSARIKTMAESLGYKAFTTSADSGPGSSFEPSYFIKETAGVAYFWLSRLGDSL
ncbi:MAG: hypothetical protein RIS09_574 [Actinomycetota bacterium]|jgi:uncharacterized SAM-binding protein YcdF (DUF218 family)